MDFEQVREQNAQHAGHQNAQEGAGNGRGAAAVKAVDQSDDQGRQQQRHRKAHPDGIVPFQIQGNQQLPDGKHRQGEGENRPQARPSREQHQKQDEPHRHQQFPLDPVMVRHGDVGDGIARVADDHLGLIPRLEELVLLQAALQHINAVGCFALEFSGDEGNRAPLLAGADQSGIHDGGIVHRRDLRHTPLGLPVLHRVLIPGGDQQQSYDQQNTRQHRRVVSHRFRSQ